MALSCAMVWQGDKRRWRKQHRGRFYYVSCSTLGTAPTKEASAAAANAWWRRKLAEIEAAHPHAAHLAELDRRRAWAASHGETIEARNLAGEIARVRAGGEPGEGDGPILADAYRAQFGEPPPAVERLRDLYGSEARWSGRLGESVPADRTIGSLVERYLARERARVDAGDLSPSEFDTIGRCLAKFSDWAGRSTGCEAIDAGRWEAWWVYLVGLEISVEYRKKLFRVAKTFVAWLGEMGVMVAPPNIHSRRYRFGAAPKIVPVLEIDTVKALIEAAPGQLKLHLALMANTGMTQKDVSDLRPSEVDWTAGRITRRRSKTAVFAAVPTVSYPLWPVTWDLLQRYGHREGDRALLTESGRPWVRDEIAPSGKRCKTDAIKSNYVHLARRLGIKTSMKLLRKTSASLLEQHEVYGRYAVMFLGQAPRTIADRHYVRPSQDLFDAAISWLGGRYGLA